MTNHEQSSEYTLGRGFSALRRPIGLPMRQLIAGIEEDFGRHPHIEIRRFNHTDEERAHEPALQLISSREIRNRNWGVGGSLALRGLFDRIEAEAPSVTESRFTTLVVADKNISPKGETYIIVKPDLASGIACNQDKLGILQATADLAEEPDRLWRPTDPGITVAYAHPEANTSDIQGVINRLNKQLLPLEVEFGPVEFYPDPRIA